MDYCELGSVKDILKRMPSYTFDEDQIAAILSYVIEALIYLHEGETPIIHRDLKSANILLTATGGVKIGLSISRLT